MPYVLEQYHDGGYQLDKAHECLEQKCGAQASASGGLEVTAAHTEQHV